MFPKTGLNNVLRMSVTSLVYLFTCLACARSTCAKWNSCIGDYFILDHLLNSYLWMPTKEKFYEYARNATHGKKCYAIQGSRKMFSWPSPRRGGTRDFKWREWSNGAKSQDPKKSLGLPAKPKKIPGPKINPPKIPCFSEPHISNPQGTSERNQKFTRKKGIPVTVKPIDWIEAVEVLFTAGHHGTMQTIA